MFCVCAGYAMLTCVAVDVVLTVLHLLETKYPAAALIPVLSAGAEVALLGLLFVNIRSAIRRTDVVAAFLPPAARA
jgi:hypothetical protein